MVKQPCPAPACPELEIYTLGLSAGGEAWEVLLSRVQSVCALKLSRSAAAWAFHKHTVSYCRAHGLFQGLAGASEDHVGVVLVLQGWNISPKKEGTGGAKQRMTEAAKGEMSQLQVKRFAACVMMNVGYTGCLFVEPHTVQKRTNSEASQERTLTHHLLHTGLELRVCIKVATDLGHVLADSRKETAV